MSRRWRSSPAGFTLVEALVIVAIIGILIAIAAPSFFGQVASSQDADARQYLNQAYRLARAQTIDAGGKYGIAGMTDAGALTGAINLAYPEYAVVATATAPDGFRDVAQANKVKLAVWVTNPSPPSPKTLKLRIRSESGKICILSSSNQGIAATACVAVEQDALASSSPPTISGNAAVGGTLQTSLGGWSGPGPLTYAFEWQRCDAGGASCAVISGASNQTYLVTDSDSGATLRAVVAAQSGGESASATTAQTTAIPYLAPVNTAVPVVAGTAQVGEVLSTTNGSWNSSPTSYSYQWQSSPNGSTWTNATGTGATTSSYTAALADLDRYLRSVVTASNSGGSGAASSAATSIVLAEAPINLAPPVVSGTAQVGEVLSTTEGDWTPTPTYYSYQWQSSPNGSTWTDTNGPGATSAAYTAELNDEGKLLHVGVTAWNNGVNSATAFSVATSVVLPPVPTLILPPTISGTAQVGEVLSTTNGDWNSSPTSFSYQWHSSPNGSSPWTEIAGATNASYTAVAADLNLYLRARVTAANAGGNSAPAFTVETNAVLPAAPTIISLPTISGTAQVGQSLSTTAGDWTSNPTSYSYQWQLSPDLSSWSDITAATTAFYIAVTADEGKYLRVRVTATNTGGSNEAFAEATSAVLPG